MIRSTGYVQKAPDACGVACEGGAGRVARGTMLTLDIPSLRPKHPTSSRSMRCTLHAKATPHDHGHAGTIDRLFHVRSTTPYFSSVANLMYERDLIEFRRLLTASYSHTLPALPVRLPKRRQLFELSDNSSCQNAHVLAVRVPSMHEPDSSQQSIQGPLRSSIPGLLKAPSVHPVNNLPLQQMVALPCKHAVSTRMLVQTMWRHENATPTMRPSYRMLGYRTRPRRPA